MCQNVYKCLFTPTLPVNMSSFASFLKWCFEPDTYLPFAHSSPNLPFFFRTSLNDWVCLLVQNKHNIQSHVINVMFLSMINYPFCRQINYSLPNYSQKLLFICPGNSYIFDTILINSGSRPTLMIGQHAKTIFKENLLTTLIMFQRKVG